MEAGDVDGDVGLATSGAAAGLATDGVLASWTAGIRATLGVAAFGVSFDKAVWAAGRGSGLARSVMRAKLPQTW